MANTADLLGFIDEFSEAFADPDFHEAVSDQISSNEKNTSSIEIDELADLASVPEEETDLEMSYFYLGQLEYEPKLMAIASSFLSELAEVATLKKHLQNEPFHQAFQKMADDGELDHLFAKPSPVSPEFGLHLPETNARQGTPECPGGLCSL